MTRDEMFALARKVAIWADAGEDLNDNLRAYSERMREEATKLGLSLEDSEWLAAVESGEALIEKWFAAG